MKYLLMTAVAAIALSGCGEPVQTGSNGATTGSDADTSRKAAERNDAAVLPSSEVMANQPVGESTGTGDNFEVTGDGPIGPKVAIDIPNNAAGYVAQAASANAYGIQAGEIMMKQSSSPAVRAFARQMIDDHRAALEKLQAAARSAGQAAATTTLMASHQSQIDELRGASSASVDGFYISQQRGAHAQAMALHSAISRSTEFSRPLASHAAETLTVVQGHARMLASLNPAT